MLQHDKVQNHFLGFAGHCLNIDHQPHYGPINEILRLEPLSGRRNKFCVYITKKLLEGYIDTSRLLKRHCIRVPSNTRLRGSF